MLPVHASRTTPAGAMPLFGTPHRRVLRCVVCDASVLAAAGAADPYPVCHAIACRMVISRRDEMTDVAFRYFLQRQAGQKRALAALSAAASARIASEANENARMWSALATVAGAPSASLQLLVPSGPARSRPLASVRRARYRAHLEAIAQHAAALAPGVPASDAGDGVAGGAASSSLPGRLCGMCGGGCCTRGENHAYLSPPTLRRFMDAQPQLSPADVVAAYVERMPAAARWGSCINHTRTGCSLPRAMRSDICNSFACDALQQLQAAPVVQVVLVVRRAQQLWLRDRPDLDNAVTGAAVLRETGLRRLSVKPAVRAGD
jgi:hypothetical protein